MALHILSSLRMSKKEKRSKKEKTATMYAVCLLAVLVMVCWPLRESKLHEQLLKTVCKNPILGHFNFEAKNSQIHMHQAVLRPVILGFLFFAPPI